MRFYDTLGDGQSQPGAGPPAGPAAVHLIETFPDLVDPVGWDADACVADSYQNGAIQPAGHSHRDGATVRAELDGIADQVVEHLPQPASISPNQGQIRLDLLVDADAGAVGRREASLNTGGHHRRDVNLLRLNRDHISLLERDNIVDKMNHRIAAVENDLQRLALAGAEVAGIAFQQVLDIALDKGQRRAQLVGNVGHKLVLQPVQLA